MEKEGNKKPKGSGGQVKVKLNVSLVLTGPDGKVKERRESNLIVNAGFNAVIKQILGAAGGGAQPGKFNYVAIGIGSAAPSVSDTTLANEIGTRQPDTDPSFPATGQGEIVAIFGAGNGTGTISEAGIFNLVTSGTLLARTTFTGIVKGALDILQVTWTISLT